MTDTSTPSLRQEFEAWVATKYYVYDGVFDQEEDGEYYRNIAQLGSSGDEDANVQSLWIGYQAATANMQQKLDQSKKEEDCSYNALMMVSKLLAQIAITLKGEKLPLQLHSYHDLPELVEKMKAEYERADRIASEQDETITKQALIIPELEANIAELQKDADRYQWLKPKILGKEYRRIGVVYGDFMSGIDEAIDAAIAEEGV